MTNSISDQAVSARAEVLRALHQVPRMLVLPNAWDAASARAVEAAGFPAVATTSSGVSAALGFKDGEAAPMPEMLAAAGRIIAAVSVPVTVDFEAGYGLQPRELVERLISVGASGYNFEDTDHGSPGTLFEAERQAEKIAALKTAARDLGTDLVLNARVDVFIHRRGTPEEQLAEGLRRARLYKDAGADCIYPILLADEAMLAQFVAAVGVVNTNLRPGGALTLAKAAAIGLRRVSYAGSIYRAAIVETERVVKEIAAEAAQIP